MPGKPLRWRRSGKPWRGETAASGRQVVAHVAHRLSPLLSDSVCFTPCESCFIGAEFFSATCRRRATSSPRRPADIHR